MSNYNIRLRTDEWACFHGKIGGLIKTFGANSERFDQEWYYIQDA
jgi:hypothetical protein